MRQASNPICITCAQSASETSRFNRFPDGRICPACRDRILASLPPLLPVTSSVKSRTSRRSRVKPRRKLR